VLKQAGIYVKLQLNGDLDVMTVYVFAFVRPVNNFHADCRKERHH